MAGNNANAGNNAGEWNFSVFDQNNQQPQQNQNMNAMNNALPPGLEKGMSAFDDDDDCELGSDIDGDE